MARPKTKVEVSCAHCGRSLWRRPCDLGRGKVGPLAGLSFCDRDCQKRYFRAEIPCCWPACQGKTLILSQRHRLKQHKSYFCEDHLDLIRRSLGFEAVATLSRRKFLAGETVGHKRIDGPFVRLVVFNLANGSCAGCERAIDQESFLLDHRHPVFEGGVSALSNLQALCRECHLRKTAEEQRRANAARWANSALAPHLRKMTHVEKDGLIQRLRDEIELLRGRLTQSSP